MKSQQRAVLSAVRAQVDRLQEERTKIEAATVEHTKRLESIRKDIVSVNERGSDVGP